MIGRIEMSVTWTFVLMLPAVAGMMLGQCLCLCMLPKAVHRCLLARMLFIGSYMLTKAMQ